MRAGNVCFNGRKIMTGLNDKILNLIESGLPVISLKSDHSEIIINSFTEISRSTGKAVYVWDEVDGLYRIDARHIPIPRTQEVEHLLKHLGRNKHYGIYVLKDIKRHLTSTYLWQLFAEAIAATADNDSMILLLGQEIQLPDSMKSLIAQIWRARKQSAKPATSSVKEAI